MKRNGYKQQTEREYSWLDYARKLLDSKAEVFNNVSWAAYHASYQPLQSQVICPTTLLPLFLESAHTVAMIKHFLHIIKSVIEHLNLRQAPVITFDQPLCALANKFNGNGQKCLVKINLLLCLVVFIFKWQL